MTLPQETHHLVPDAAISGLVRALLVESSPPVRIGVIETLVPTIDIDRSVLATAGVVLRQLQVLGHRCVQPAQTPRLIAGITDLAGSFGLASPTAIGVIGMLVDELLHPNEAALAKLLASARFELGDVEVVAAAVALMAASTMYLADAYGAVPVEVHDEMHRQRPPRGAGRCRIHHDPNHSWPS